MHIDNHTTSKVLQSNATTASPTNICVLLSLRKNHVHSGTLMSALNFMLLTPKSWSFQITFTFLEPLFPFDVR